MASVVFLDMEHPRTVEPAHAMQFHYWLHVLACPRLYRNMKRKPTREHMLSLHRGYLPYAKSTRAKADEQGYFCTNVDEARRATLADRLGELFELWITNDVSEEITETAQALLDVEGYAAPAGGWQNLSDPDVPPEEFLLWPEGVPLLLKQSAQQK